MIVRDQELAEIDEQAWERFIAVSNNGTLFSKPCFYHHHDEPVPVRFIGCYEGEDLLAGLVGAFSEDRNVFISPVKASYGGIILPPASFSDTEKALTVILEYFKTIDVRRIQLTFPPLLYQRQLNQDLDFLLRYHGFRESLTLISSIVSTSEYSEKSISRDNWKSIKKARNSGVRIRPLDDFGIFYELLLHNKKKFDLKPTHSLSEIKQLFRLFPNEMNLTGAWLDDKLIAATMTMHCHPRVLLVFYICSLTGYNRYRPVNLMMHKVILQAKEAGIPAVDFGVSMETDTDNPMDPRRSLIYFKEHFNTHGFLRVTYEWGGDQLTANSKQ